MNVVKSPSNILYRFSATIKRDRFLRFFLSFFNPAQNVPISGELSERFFRILLTTLSVALCQRPKAQKGRELHTFPSHCPFKPSLQKMRPQLRPTFCKIL